MERLQIITLTLPGLPDPAIAVAGSRAGGIGVLDLEYVQDELSALESSFGARETETAKRAEDLKRREHVLAQRWTRLMAATCSHCGNPVNIRAPGGPDASS